MEHEGGVKGCSMKSFSVLSHSMIPSDFDLLMDKEYECTIFLCTQRGFTQASSSAGMEI